MHCYLSTPHLHRQKGRHGRQAGTERTAAAADFSDKYGREPGTGGVQKQGENVERFCNEGGVRKVFDAKPECLRGRKWGVSPARQGTKIRSQESSLFYTAISVDTLLSNKIGRLIPATHFFWTPEYSIAEIITGT